MKPAQKEKLDPEAESYSTATTIHLMSIVVGRFGLHSDLSRLGVCAPRAPALSRRRTTLEHRGPAAQHGPDDFLGVGTVDSVDDGCRHFGSLGLAAQIGSVEAIVGGHALDRLHQPIAGSFLTEMLEHHYHRPERADRVGNPFAHYVEG